jgi:hypothetical protein
LEKDATGNFLPINFKISDPLDFVIGEYSMSLAGKDIKLDVTFTLQGKDGGIVRYTQTFVEKNAKPSAESKFVGDVMNGMQTLRKTALGFELSTSEGRAKLATALLAMTLPCFMNAVSSAELEFMISPLVSGEKTFITRGGEVHQTGARQIEKVISDLRIAAQDPTNKVAAKLLEIINKGKTTGLDNQISLMYALCDYAGKAKLQDLSPLMQLYDAFFGEWVFAGKGSFAASFDIKHGNELIGRVGYTRLENGDFVPYAELKVNGKVYVSYGAGDGTFTKSHQLGTTPDTVPLNNGTTGIAKKIALFNDDGKTLVKNDPLTMALGAAAVQLGFFKSMAWLESSSGKFLAPLELIAGDTYKSYDRDGKFVGVYTSVFKGGTAQLLQPNGDALKETAKAEETLVTWGASKPAKVYSFTEDKTTYYIGVDNKGFEAFTAIKQGAELIILTAANHETGMRWSFLTPGVYLWQNKNGVQGVAGLNTLDSKLPEQSRYNPVTKQLTDMKGNPITNIAPMVAEANTALGTARKLVLTSNFGNTGLDLKAVNAIARFYGAMFGANLLDGSGNFNGATILFDAQGSAVWYVNSANPKSLSTEGSYLIGVGINARSVAINSETNGWVTVTTGSEQRHLDSKDLTVTDVSAVRQHYEQATAANITNAGLLTADEQQKTIGLLTSMGVLHGSYELMVGNKVVPAQFDSQGQFQRAVINGVGILWSESEKTKAANGGNAAYLTGKPKEIFNDDPRAGTFAAGSKAKELGAGRYEAVGAYNFSKAGFAGASDAELNAFGTFVYNSGLGNSELRMAGLARFYAGTEQVGFGVMDKAGNITQGVINGVGILWSESEKTKAANGGNAAYLTGKPKEIFNNDVRTGVFAEGSEPAKQGAKRYEAVGAYNFSKAGFAGASDAELNAFGTFVYNSGLGNSDLKMAGLARL